MHGHIIDTIKMQPRLCSLIISVVDSCASRPFHLDGEDIALWIPRARVRIRQLVSIAVLLFGDVDDTKRRFTLSATLKQKRVAS
jgi:hypothetical protein